MSHQLSEEQLSKLKETIRKRIREFTGTANVAGYNTPHAFGKDTKGDIKRKVKSAGTGFEYAKSISENRWLELKRDETRTPSQKVSHGIRELKNQLAEIEKFMGWYSKLKSETNLGKADFFKRTENNIRKIKERIIRMANTIQEIDSEEAKEENINELFNVKVLPNWLFNDVKDFQYWYKNGMPLGNNKGKLARLNSSDEKKLFDLVKKWRNDDPTAKDNIKQLFKQKGKVVKNEEVKEENINEVEPKKPMAVDKYVVTATPKGASKDADRRTITRPAPKNSAEIQLKSLKKMDKYQSVRLKKA